MLFLFLSMLNEEEQEKFTALYYKYKNLMYTIAFSQTNDKYSSEDCVQQAFEYIAKNFQKIDDVDSKSTRNLIADITKCIGIKTYYKQTNTIPIDDCINYFEFSSNAEDEYIKKSNIDSLRNAINKLDDMYKIPLYLKTIHGFRSKEIAELMGLSDDVVRRRVFVAKKKVKVILEKEMKIDE